MVCKPSFLYSIFIYYTCFPQGFIFLNISRFNCFLPHSIMLQENLSMIKKVAGKKVEGLTCQYLWNCCLLQAKRRNLPQKSKLLASGVKLSRASNRIPRYGQVVITFCLWWLSGVSIVEYVKHCPLNNYFILHCIVRLIKYFAVFTQIIYWLLQFTVWSWMLEVYVWSTAVQKPRESGPWPERVTSRCGTYTKP